MLKFGNSHFLWLLFLIPATAGFYWISFRLKTKALERFGQAGLMKKLTASVSRSKQKWKAALMVLGVVFMTLALARPQIGTRLEEMKREGVDIFIALDVSASMLAEDIKPSRLAKAKHEISAFIDLLNGDRIGLIAFAGESFVQCPLTLDYGAAKTFLEIMDPGLIPEPGTNLSAAIKTALKSFDANERKYKALVLITDGEDHGDDIMEVVEMADREGAVIYTVGIGSPQGAPIPVYDKQGRREFKKDKKGEVVLTKLDQLTLEKIALTTNGKYYQSVTGETKLEIIYQEIAKMEKKELASRKFSQYEDRFQYALLFAIFFLLLELFVSDRIKSTKEWKGRFE